MSAPLLSDCTARRDTRAVRTYMAPEPYLSRRLWTTLASLRNVRSAMSSTRSNLGGFILLSAYRGTLRI